VKTVGESWQLSGAQGAGVGQGTEWLTLYITLLLPLRKVSQGCHFSGILHPLDHLKCCDEVDIVSAEHVSDELDEFLLESLVLLDPLSVEMKTKWGSVGGEMSVKVVLQHPGKLIRIDNVGAGGHQMTSRKGLVECWVISSVKLVDDHLPDGMRSGWTFASVAVTFVGHSEVEGVGPLGHAGQGGSDGGVVGEELIGHHLELLVASHAEEGGSDSGDGAVSDVGEPLDDQTSSGHLSQPVVVASFAPVVGVIFVGHGEDGDLVTFPVKFLNSGIVGVSVGHEECSFDGATVGVDGLFIEEFLVQINIVRVNGPIESNCDHLRYLVWINISRDSCSIRGTETVRQETGSGITFWGTIGILINTTGILIGTILTINLFITEKSFTDALSVATLKLILGTYGLVCSQVRQGLPWL